MQSRLHTDSPSSLQKIILIGSGGSGKSTLARKLGEILEMPVHHLDCLHWKPGWVSTPKEEWRQIQEEVCSGGEWIIDGNYGGTMGIRLNACDTIIFLDMPRSLCILRALKRFLTYRGRTRPDMTAGCNEQITAEFFRWIWEFPRLKRPRILGTLEKLKEEKAVFILRSPREVACFVEKMRQQAA